MILIALKGFYEGQKQHDVPRSLPRAVLEEEDITVKKIRLITDDESALYQQFIDTFETVTIVECRLCRVHWDKHLRKWLETKHKLKHLKYSNPNFLAEFKDQFKVISNFLIFPIWMIQKIIQIFKERPISAYLGLESFYTYLGHRCTETFLTRLSWLPEVSHENYYLDMSTNRQESHHR